MTTPPKVKSSPEQLRALAVASLEAAREQTFVPDYAGISLAASALRIADSLEVLVESGIVIKGPSGIQMGLREESE